MEPFQQADLTPQEKADLDRAWRTSILRYSSTSYRPRLIKLALSVVAFSAVLLSFAVLPAVAYLAHFPKQYAPGDLVGSVAGWSMSATLLLGRRRAMLRGPDLIMSALLLGIALALNPSRQLRSGSAALAVPAGYVALSAVIGFAGLPLILQLVRTFDWIDHRVGMTFSRRLRASDVLFVQVARCAAAAWSALSAQWQEPAFSRQFIRDLQLSARRLDQAPVLSRRAGWSQFRLRSREGAPYFAVATVLRDHAQNVATAKTSDDWLLICQSLTAGAVAAARDDWEALLAHAPSRTRARRGLVLQMLRRLSAPTVLALSAILLPIWVSLGSYGASVRTSLLVAAVLSLLPGNAGSDTVNGVLAKALPFRSGS